MERCDLAAWFLRLVLQQFLEGRALDDGRVMRHVIMALI